MSSIYERELKGILAADADVLRRFARSCPPEEAACYLKIEKRPFLVVRGAGSLGVDLVALRGDFSFPIEVKSASSDVIHFSSSSGRNNDQADAMSRECGRASVIPLYAFRRKGVRGADPWRIHTLPTDGLPPRVQLLYDRIPKVERSAGGKYILRWHDGMPAHKLLDFLCS